MFSVSHGVEALLRIDLSYLQMRVNKVVAWQDAWQNLRATTEVGLVVVLSMTLARNMLSYQGK